MLNMFAVIWNEYIKDIVIAHDEEEARELASDGLVDIDASGVPVKMLDDTLQTMTKQGLMTLREVINYYDEPRYLHGIDSISIQV